MSRVLVTGATGFIGGHLARRLHHSGDEVRCLVRAGSDRSALNALGLRCIVGDTADTASLARALGDADAVIHAAAMLKMPWRSDFHSANVEGTAHIAAACAARSSPPLLIVVSSLAAAGPADAGRSRDENDAAAPISIYGRAKRDAERAAARYASRLPISIVRPPMVFGDGDRACLPLFRNVARGWHLRPAGRDHALSMIHVADLADLLQQLLTAGERLVAGDDGSHLHAQGRGLYYASADETPSLSGLGAEIASALACPAPRTIQVPRAALLLAAAYGECRGRYSGRPQLLNLDKARELGAGPWLCSALKARRDLGFAPEPLARRLRQTALDYRERGWLR